MSRKFEGISLCKCQRTEHSLFLRYGGLCVTAHPENFCKIFLRTCPRPYHLSTDFLQEMCWPSSRVWPSVIVQQDNTGTKHPVPLVLNGPLQFLQCFAVTFSIHCLTSDQEVDEENAPSVPEHRAHNFSRLSWTGPEFHRRHYGTAAKCQC